MSCVFTLCQTHFKAVTGETLQQHPTGTEAQRTSGVPSSALSQRGLPESPLGRPPPLLPSSAGPCPLFAGVMLVSPPGRPRSRPHPTP